MTDVEEVDTMTDTQEREVGSGHYKVTSHWNKVIWIEGMTGTAKGTWRLSCQYQLRGVW